MKQLKLVYYIKKIYILKYNKYCFNYFLILASLFWKLIVECILHSIKIFLNKVELFLKKQYFLIIIYFQDLIFLQLLIILIIQTLFGIYILLFFLY